MNFDEYQNRTESTNIYSSAISDLLYPIERAITTNDNDAVVSQAALAMHKVREILNYYYVVLGLVGEAGELANKAKKWVRDGGEPEGMDGEVEDCLWYIAQIAIRRNKNLSGYAQGNLDNLSSRKERGKLNGSGDNR